MSSNQTQAANSEHKFRYLLPPGSNFQFVSRFRLFFAISVLLIGASIGMLFVNKAVRGEMLNWTIDFKGGTELIFAFKDKNDPQKFVPVAPGVVRNALRDSGEANFDVSEMAWEEKGKDGSKSEVKGIVIRAQRFAAVSKATQDKAREAFAAKFADRQLSKVVWSGERLYVRSKTAIGFDEAAAVFSGNGLELKPWSEEEKHAYSHADEGTLEYQAVFAMYGLDRQFAQAIEKAAPNVSAVAMQSYGVGAKAGDKLRDDAVKSMIFALLLIAVYLVFRFDIRYAPGALYATVHDAVIVVGVFAVTWTEVSLTSVAALLTVIGYSVNDTVIIFDRIRENQQKHKGKAIERIIDMSINETLVRSILTALTVFATTLLMNLFGDGLVRNFAFAMNIGVVVGTFSSIFMASPLFYWISKKWYSGPVKVRAGAERAAAVAAEP